MSGRVIVLGMDALVLPLIKRFVAEGALPNFQRLLNDGSYSYALSVLPPYTPTNWATIASGALPGRHGAGNWTDVTVSDPIGRKARSTFDARALHADTVWNAASRAGLHTMLVTYPGSYPTKFAGVTIVAPLYRGLTGHVLASGGEYDIDLSSGQRIKLPVKSQSSGPLLLPTEDGHQELYPEGLEHFSGFEISRDNQTIAIYWHDAPLVVLAENTWSAWTTIPDGHGGQASVRFRLLNMTDHKVHLIRSEIYPIQGFTDPPSYADEIYRAVGPFFEHPAAINRESEEAVNALLEELQDQVDWYIGVAKHSAENRPWDLFMTHWHWIDTAQHNFLTGLDPEPGVDPDERAVSIIRKSYQLGDRLLGGFLGQMKPMDHLMVVSDHGHVPNRRIASVTRRLVETGLAVFDEKRLPSQVIDRTRSKVYLLSPHEIVVNLEGRNDGGIVPQTEYQVVAEAALDALLDWKDPETGKRLVAYALERSHQQILGYFGSRVGDVMFLYNSGYSWGTPQHNMSVGPSDGSSNHGAQLPTTTTERTANMATLMALGPSIRSGYERRAEDLGYVSLTDITPLISHLLGIVPPIDCRGAVPRDFLQSTLK